jgi:hypothetical protein
MVESSIHVICTKGLFFIQLNSRVGKLEIMRLLVFILCVTFTFHLNRVHY